MRGRVLAFFTRHVTMVRIYTVDGNIGAGKSTVLQVLQRRGYTVLLEPIDVWAKYLAAAYSNDPKGVLRLQLAVWRDRCMKPPRPLEHDTDKNPSPGVVFMERSAMFQLRTFVLANYERGRLDNLDMDLLTSLYESIEWTPEVMFYLRVLPGICARRVKQRGRAYEHDIHEYIEQLHEKHEVVAASVSVSCPVVTLDGDRPPAEIADELIDLVFGDSANFHHPPHPGSMYPASIEMDLNPIDPSRLEDPINYIPLPVTLEDPDPLHRAFLPNAEVDKAHEIIAVDTADYHNKESGNRGTAGSNASRTTSAVSTTPMQKVADALDTVGKSIQFLANALKSSTL